MRGGGVVLLHSWSIAWPVPGGCGGGPVEKAIVLLWIPAARFIADLAPCFFLSVSLMYSLLIVDRHRPGGVCFAVTLCLFAVSRSFLSCDMADRASAPHFSFGFLAVQGYEPLSGKHEVLYRGDLPWEVRGKGGVLRKKSKSAKQNLTCLVSKLVKRAALHDATVVVG